jgi:hypothetical protein
MCRASDVQPTTTDDGRRRTTTDDARVAIRAHPSRRRRSRSRRGRRKNTRTFLLLNTTVSHTPIHAHEATMSASMTTTRASSSVAARSASVATKASKRSSVVAAAADRKMWCVYILREMRQIRARVRRRVVDGVAHHARGIARGCAISIVSRGDTMDRSCLGLGRRRTRVDRCRRGV